MDIEDLVKEGQKRDACPYYCACPATEMAENITLLFQLLVIIDEVHNLIPGISDLYSAKCAKEEVDSPYRGLVGYLKGQNKTRLQR